MGSDTSITVRRSLLVEVTYAYFPETYTPLPSPMFVESSKKPFTDSGPETTVDGPLLKGWVKPPRYIVSLSDGVDDPIPTLPEASMTNGVVSFASSSIYKVLSAHIFLMEKSAAGVPVPMPIRGMPFADDPIERIGDTLVDVANENALTVLSGIVVVADFWNASVSDAADDEANVITFESR